MANGGGDQTAAAIFTEMKAQQSGDCNSVSPGKRSVQTNAHRHVTGW